MPKNDDVGDDDDGDGYGDGDWVIVWQFFLLGEWSILLAEKLTVRL